ncbi:hypothetical protein [Leucobacter musarum]|uniref:hypothetical protein n=1 Tax=Leucobacter musarum TaxID=1930747 RepID=UPI0012E13F52|nr:hypothetical protein [Leucobacter musarum]
MSTHSTTERAPRLASSAPQPAHPVHLSVTVPSGAALARLSLLDRAKLRVGLWLLLRSGATASGRAEHQPTPHELAVVAREARAAYDAAAAQHPRLHRTL